MRKNRGVKVKKTEANFMCKQSNIRNSLPNSDQQADDQLFPRKQVFITLLAAWKSTKPPLSSSCLSTFLLSHMVRAGIPFGQLGSLSPPSSLCTPASLLAGQSEKLKRPRYTANIAQQKLLFHQHLATLLSSQI